MIKISKNNGFTLIEVTIYIALFSLLMGTAFITAYQLIDGSSKLSAKTSVQDEGNFVMRKFDWAMTGMKTFSIISSGHILITKYTGDTVEIKLSGGAVQIEENGGTFASTTTSNVTINNLSFQSVGTNPLGVSATTTINGVDFNITRYIRK